MLCVRDILKIFLKFENDLYSKGASFSYFHLFYKQLYLLFKELYVIIAFIMFLLKNTCNHLVPDT